MIHRSLLGAALAAFTVLACLDTTPLRAEDSFSPKQQKAIKELVRDYILKNPEILVEAMDQLRKRQKQEQIAAGRRAVKVHKAALRHSPESPFTGDPKGDVVVVEFFDYRCGVCKRVFPIVTKLLETDQKIRFVFKEWPILGDESVFAAKAALASKKQGKYVLFHNALMKERAALNPAGVMAAAKRVGLDTDKLRADMKSRAIEQEIRKNYALAEALKLNGTPSFVVGDTIVRGGRDYQSMLSLVKAARNSAKPAKTGG